MNNSKIVSTKTTSAIFLAIVLVTGTIALYFSSFMTTPANAQTEPPYYYEMNEYTGYGMDMTNEYVDKEYKPQSYGNNNYESEYPLYYNNDRDYKSKDSKSVDIKRIKCNNINSNLNGLESSTDINGLIGVGGGDESIQDQDASANAYGYNRYKNNGNFDIDCINNNDNEGGQGITGPAGPEGPQGPQGPQGINVINASNFYSVQGPTRTIEVTGTGITSIASCDPGDTAISGEYAIEPAGGTSTTGTYDVRLFDGGGTNWDTLVVGLAGTSVTTTVHCFDNPPLRP